MKSIEIQCNTKHHGKNLCSLAKSFIGAWYGIDKLERFDTL